jgi:hypothetical protein
MINVTRVIHLGRLRASGVLGDTVATAEAGLGGGVRWRARVHADLGAGEGANRAERKPKQGDKAMVQSCRGPAPRSGGGGVPACVVWPQGWATAYRT